MTTSGTTQEQLCADVSEMIGFHATNVLEKLNGFQGYGAVGYTIISGTDSLQGVQAFIDAKGPDVFARATIDMGIRTSLDTHMLMPVLDVLDDRFDVGIVPKKVFFDGRRITTDHMFVYYISLNRVRGPYPCQMSDKNIWERVRPK